MGDGDASILAYQVAAELVQGTVSLEYMLTTLVALPRPTAALRTHHHWRAFFLHTGVVHQMFKSLTIFISVNALVLPSLKIVKNVPYSLIRVVDE